MKKRVSLTVIEGPDAGLTHTFAGGVCHIGRGRGEMPLSDKKVSGKHVKIFFDRDLVLIEDVGSTNGTFLGGRKVDKAEPLQNLDTIVVGLSKISVAIVDDMSSFRDKNVDSGYVSRSSGFIDIEDVDMASEGDVLDGLFDESVSRPSSKSKTAYVSPAERADQIEDEKTVQAKESAKRPVSPQGDLPDPNAQYRETGIERINNLIQDELETFSKWDHPAVSDARESSGPVPKIKVNLKVRRGPEGVTSVSCSQPVTTFGRKDVDVRLNDLDVSRKHASLEIINGDRAFVRDMASTNGTFVNGKKVSYQEIHSGDLIQVGQTIFEVAIDGPQKK